MKRLVERSIGRVTCGAGVSQWEWALAVSLTRQPRFWIFRVHVGPLYAFLEG